MRRYFYQLANDDIHGLAAALLKGILFFLSLVYLGLLRIVTFLYATGALKSYRSRCKVISVGNITWGGTGKTPLVHMLADYLVHQGKNPAVIIRGYKSKSGNSISDCQKMGEEAFMLSQALKLPILMGRDRIASARKAEKDPAIDTIILDDGFQHWRMKRDLDIVAIDSANPFGNGWLIPRGILREPLSALKRVGIFFLTRTDQAGEKTIVLRNRLNRINPTALVVESIHQPVGFYDILQKDQFLIPSDIRGKTAFVCSIGNPAAFEKTLLDLGLKPDLKFIFLDHHHYRTSEINAVIDSCKRQGINCLITTQKDAVGLEEHLVYIKPDLKVLVLQVKIAITKGKDEFFSRLSGMYSA